MDSVKITPRASLRIEIERAQINLAAMQKGHCCLEFGSHDTISEILEITFTHKPRDLEEAIFQFLSPAERKSQIPAMPHQRLCDLVNIPTAPNKPPTKSIIFARLYLLLSVILGARSVSALGKNDYSASLLLHTRASIYLGNYMGETRASYGVNSVSTIAAMGAEAKLANDPKQLAKSSVKECWLLWQEDSGRYKGPTAFARDMREKFEALDSEEVIRRWCREWKSATEQA